MIALPAKPAAVAHVSDQHWEDALMAACRTRGLSPDVLNVLSEYPTSIIDHARCLILLGEVPEPVDPIEAALDATYQAWIVAGMPFKDACRKHFAGLTFPVQP